jgi:hypothetical protein
MLDSRSYFYQLGAAGMSIYQGIREGFNERVWKLKDAQTYMENAMQGMNVKDWTGNHAKVHTFVINGGELKLTTAQIMSIYELRKRGQALVHMLNGGIKPTQIGKGAKAITRVKPMKNLTEFDLDSLRMPCSSIWPVSAPDGEMTPPCFCTGMKGSMHPAISQSAWTGTAWTRRMIRSSSG